MCTFFASQTSFQKSSNMILLFSSEMFARCRLCLVPLTQLHFFPYTLVFVTVLNESRTSFFAAYVCPLWCLNLSNLLLIFLELGCNGFFCWSLHACDTDLGFSLIFTSFCITEAMNAVSNFNILRSSKIALISDLEVVTVHIRLSCRYQSGKNN